MISETPKSQCLETIQRKLRYFLNLHSINIFCSDLYYNGREFFLRLIHKPMFFILFQVFIRIYQELDLWYF